MAFKPINLFKPNKKLNANTTSKLPSDALSQASAPKQAPAIPLNEFGVSNGLDVMKGMSPYYKTGHFKNEASILKNRPQQLGYSIAEPVQNNIQSSQDRNVFKPIAIPQKSTVNTQQTQIQQQVPQQKQEKQQEPLDITNMNSQSAIRHLTDLRAGLGVKSDAQIQAEMQQLPEDQREAYLQRELDKRKIAIEQNAADENAVAGLRGVVGVGGGLTQALKERQLANLEPLQQQLARMTAERELKERKKQQEFENQIRREQLALSKANTYSQIADRKARLALAQAEKDASDNGVNLPKMSSGEKDKFKDLYSFQNALKNMKQIVQQSGKSPSELLLGQDEASRAFRSNKENAIDILARDRTGAVVSKDEQKTFKKILGVGAFRSATSDPNEFINTLDRNIQNTNPSLDIYDPTGEWRAFLEKRNNTNQTIPSGSSGVTSSGIKYTIE